MYLSVYFSFSYITCEADIVRSRVEVSKRELNRPIKKNEPLTADLMKLLFLKFNTVNRTLKELKLLVICALSYTGVLRYNELRVCLTPVLKPQLCF
jgi:hypothetical protein